MLKGFVGKFSLSNPSGFAGGSALGAEWRVWAGIAPVVGHSGGGVVERAALERDAPDIPEGDVGVKGSKICVNVCACDSANKKRYCYNQKKKLIFHSG